MSFNIAAIGFSHTVKVPNSVTSSNVNRVMQNELPVKLINRGAAIFTLEKIGKPQSATYYELTVRNKRTQETEKINAFTRGPRIGFVVEPRDSYGGIIPISPYLAGYPFDSF